jgi:hypothetical protein
MLVWVKLVVISYTVIYYQVVSESDYVIAPDFHAFHNLFAPLCFRCTTNKFEKPVYGYFSVEDGLRFEAISFRILFVVVEVPEAGA